MVFKININVSNRVLVVLGVIGVLLIGGAIYLGFKVIPGLIDDKIWEVSNK